MLLVPPLFEDPPEFVGPQAKAGIIPKAVTTKIAKIERFIREVLLLVFHPQRGNRWGAASVSGVSLQCLEKTPK